MEDIHDGNNKPGDGSNSRETGGMEVERKGDDPGDIPKNSGDQGAPSATQRHKRFKKYIRGSSASPSITELIRARQRHGRVRFVGRPGAGVWSPDPLQQATGNYPHFLRRMEISGELVGHKGCVNTISATPDGKFWITGSDDLELKIWDCESHQRKMSVASGHVNNVFQARALPYTDNKKIVTCAADGQVRVMDLNSMTNISMGEHRGWAHRIAIVPGSPHQFMSCGEDGIVLTFDLRVVDKGSVLLTTPGPTGIKGMALNPLDPNYFFICGDSPNLHLYDARKVDIPAASYCPHSLRSSRETITGCAVNWCGTEVVATYNPSGEIYRFNVKDHAANLRGYRRYVRQRTGTEERGSVSASRRPPGGLRALDRDDDDDDDDDEEKEEEEEEEEEEEVESDSSNDFVGTRNAEEREPSYGTRFTGHRNIHTVKQVAFYGPRSEYVISGSDCGHIFMWEKDTGKLEMLLWGDKVGAVNCLEPHPFLPNLATSGLAKTAKIWRPVRREATKAGKLKGKRGKSAEALATENRDQARRDARRRTIDRSIHSAMILSIITHNPIPRSSASHESDVGGSAGDEDSWPEAEESGGNRRRNLVQLLELVQSSVGAVSDVTSLLNGAFEEGDEQEEEEEEEEEEEDGGVGEVVVDVDVDVEQEGKQEEKQEEEKQGDTREGEGDNDHGDRDDFDRENEA